MTLPPSRDIYSELCFALDKEPTRSHRLFWENSRDWLDLCHNTVKQNTNNSQDLCNTVIVHLTQFEVSLNSSSNFIERLKPYALDAFQERWAVWFKNTSYPPPFENDGLKILYRCKFSQVQVLLQMKRDYLSVRFRCCLTDVSETSKHCQIFRYLFWKAVMKTSGQRCGCCLLNKNNVFWNEVVEKMSNVYADLFMRTGIAKMKELRELIVKKTTKADNLALFLSQRSKVSTSSACIFRIPGTFRYSSYWNSSKPCRQSRISGGLVLGSIGTGKTRSMLALFLDGLVWHSVRDVFFDVYVYPARDINLVQDICRENQQVIFVVPGEIQKVSFLLREKHLHPGRTRLVLCSSDLSHFLRLGISTNVMVLDTDVFAVASWPSQQTAPECLFVVSNRYSLSLISRIYALWDLKASFGISYSQLRRDTMFDLISSVTYLFTFSDLFSEGQDVGEFELLPRGRLSAEDESLILRAVISCSASGNEYNSKMLIRLLNLIEWGSKDSFNHLSRVCIRFLASQHQESLPFALMYNCSALLKYGPCRNVSECCICQNVCSSPIQVTTCSHVFCFECIYQWNIIKSTCPLCVQKFQHYGFLKVPGQTYQDTELLQPSRFTPGVREMVQQTVMAAVQSTKPVLICCNNPQALNVFSELLGDDACVISDQLSLELDSKPNFFVCSVKDLKLHSHGNFFKTVINFDGNQYAIVCIATGFVGARKVHMYIRGLHSFNTMFNLFKLVDPFFEAQSNCFQLKNMFTC